MVSRYGTFGSFQHDFGVIALLQLCDDDFDVLLSGAGDQKFLRLRIAEETKHRIFFHELVQAGSELVFIGATLGFNSKCDGGLGKFHTRILNGRGLVAQGIARQGVFQFRDGADISGVEFVHGNSGFALHHGDVSEFFLHAAAVVQKRRVILQNAGENFEIRDASGERVGDSLEYIEGDGLFVSLVALGSIAVAGGFALDPFVFGGRGSVVDDEIHDTVGTDVSESGAEDNGENLVFANGVVQRGNKVFFSESTGLEEFFHQLVVAFGNEFDEVLVGFLRLILKIGGDLRLFAFAVPAHLVGIGLHADEVDDAGQTFFGADGELDGNDVAAEGGGQRFHDTLGVGAIAIHAIHDDEARRLIFLAIIPDTLGDDFDSGDSVDNNDGGVDDRKVHFGLMHEHAESGSVENVDLGRAPLDVRQGRWQSTFCGQFLLRRNRWRKIRHRRGRGVE